MLVKESRLIEDEPGHFIEGGLGVDKRSLLRVRLLVVYLNLLPVLSIINPVHLITRHGVLIHRFLLLDEPCSGLICQEMQLI